MCSPAVNTINSTGVVVYDMPNTGPGRILQSTSTSLRVVDALVELDGARVTEVANELGISKSAASNHLQTLKNAGYAVTHGDEYYPSLKFTYVSKHARNRDRAYRAARETTQRLDEQVPFETSFIVEENGIGRYLTPEVNQPGKHDEFAFAGQEEHLHATAAGKAILATYSTEKIERIIDRRGLPEKTEHTITTKSDLFEELDRVRDRGYAVNRSENRQGIYVIAKAVHKPHGSVLGAMSVVSPSYRLTDGDFDERTYELLDEYVQTLEDRLESGRYSERSIE